MGEDGNHLFLFLVEKQGLIDDNTYLLKTEFKETPICNFKLDKAFAFDVWEKWIQLSKKSTFSWMNDHKKFRDFVKISTERRYHQYLCKKGIAVNNKASEKEIEAIPEELIREIHNGYRKKLNFN